MKEVLVILPDDNAEALLSLSLVRLVEQSRKDFRVVVVENEPDGDLGTAAALTECQIIPIVCGYEELSTSLTKGLAMADTVIIAHLDPNDTASATRLAAQLGAFVISPRRAC
jgi:glycosyltransferase involved in cell wall biosynthesis